MEACYDESKAEVNEVKEVKEIKEGGSSGGPRMAGGPSLTLWNLSTQKTRRGYHSNNSREN